MFSRVVHFTLERSRDDAYVDALRPLMVPPFWMMLPLSVARNLWLGGSGRTFRAATTAAAPFAGDRCLASSRGNDWDQPRLASGIGSPFERLDAVCSFRALLPLLPILEFVALSTR